MDKLEDYIKNNRNAFDSFQPRSKWAEIEKALDADRGGEENIPVLNRINTRTGETVIRRLKPHSRWLKFAAVLAGAILIAAWLISRNNNQSIQIDNHNYSPVFAELEQAQFYYQQQVSDLMGQINGQSILSSTEMEQVWQFLDELQIEYEELQKDLADSPDANKVATAMIQNYRQRLNVLERLLKLSSIDEASEKNDYENSITL